MIYLEEHYSNATKWIAFYQYITWVKKLNLTAEELADYDNLTNIVDNCPAATRQEAFREHEDAFHGYSDEDLKRERFLRQKFIGISETLKTMPETQRRLANSRSPESQAQAAAMIREMAELEKTRDGLLKELNSLCVATHAAQTW
ncbi:MAG: hypothetical protein LBB23_03355 [Rickettsiales bacterium]|nr:hypothetical protein [Rickettsiales bacterium]